MESVIQGLELILTPMALLTILAGVFLGIILGIIPGIGAGVGISILLPLIFNLPPLTGLLLLLALWAADSYGGSISAILLNVPGTSGAVATCFDGHPMAMKGKAGEAIGIAMGASVTGGIIGTIFLMLVAPQIARLAVDMGPAEYTIMAILGMTLVGGLSTDSPVKGLISAVIGLATSFIGYDLITGFVRYNFGSQYLFDGINIILVVLGMYAIASLVNAGQKGGTVAELGKMSGSVVNGFMQAFKKPLSSLRGTLIGVFIGAMPGIGMTLASLVGYDVEKRLHKHPELFGTGVAEGILGPESANNAVQPAALIPTLTLGIPGSFTAAIFLAALIMYGISPGYNLFYQENGYFVWALMWGIIVASMSFVIVGMLFANQFAKLTVTPIEYLAPITMVICFVGAFSENSSYFDIFYTVLFGMIGYMMMLLKYPIAPAVLGVIIGPILERNFFRGLLISGGDYGIFFSSTFCNILWIFLLLILFGRYPLRFVRKTIEARKA